MSALLELVPLIEQARVIAVGVKRIFIHTVGGLRIAEHIELGDAQVSPRNGKGSIQFDRSAPTAYRLIVAALVVIEIAEIIVRPGCGGIARDSALQYDHLLDASGEAVSRRCGFGFDERLGGACGLIQSRGEPGER